MRQFHLQLPLNREEVKNLRAGDLVYLTGNMMTARDAAHKRIVAAMEGNGEVPFAINGQTIYYVGPAPASQGHAVGSAGPTTSYRMDAYAPKLLDAGLIGMIGKGKRNQEVIDAIVRNGGIYFGATGGAAALISRCIKASRVVAYPDLGAEAVHEFTVEDFPCIVIIDSLGNNLYETGVAQYRKE